MLTARQNRANRLIFVFALFGLFASFYLFVTYINYSPISCLSGEGCEIVRNSPFAYPLGIPMPLLGILGFSLTIFLNFLLTTQAAKFKPLLIKCVLAFTALGFISVAVLTSLEAFVIKAYCSWCLMVAFIQTAIFIVAVYLFKLTKNESRV